MEYYNNETGRQPSDPNFAIGNICFSLERLPSKLLRTLPKQYISDHLHEFITNLRRDNLGGIPRKVLIERLQELQR